MGSLPNRGYPANNPKLHYLMIERLRNPAIGPPLRAAPTDVKQGPAQVSCSTSQNRPRSSRSLG